MTSPLLLTLCITLLLGGDSVSLQGTDAPPCEHLRLMTRLARIGGSPDVGTIAKQADLTCSTQVDADRWPNNERIRSRTGRWDYPGGATAKTPPGHWYYPDGKTTARTITNDWYYPDGRTEARNRRGGWIRPDGRSTSVEALLTWSCDRVDADLCKQLMADYKRTSGDERILVLIELAWTAHQGSARGQEP